MKVYWLSLLLCAPHIIAQSLDDVIIPSKTEIFIELQRTINSRTAQTGDKFLATVAAPVAVDDRIIIPVGSYIIGQVEMAKGSGRVKGKSQLWLNCDTVILPTGVTRKMESVVIMAEGYSSRDTDERGVITHGGSQGGEVAKGAGTGGAAGGTIGAISGGLKGAGVGAAIGAGAAGLVALFGRDDIVLDKGSSVTIQLDTDVRFVKPTPPKKGEILKVPKDGKGL